MKGSYLLTFFGGGFLGMVVGGAIRQHGDNHTRIAVLAVCIGFSIIGVIRMFRGMNTERSGS
jgi:hypothetical protein